MMIETTPLAACCDIGATKVLIGLVDEEGHVLARDRYLLGAGREPGQVVAELASHFRSLAAQAGLPWDSVAGVGCSTTGMLDLAREIIFSSPNMGPWRDVPFRALLRDALGLPVWMEMDAYAAALGEAWRGAGAGTDDFVYVVVGTGIGAGIIARGQIYRGWRGTAGEFGHTTIDPNGPSCGCGNFGCLEAMAAGPAIALRAQGTLLQGRRTLIRDMAADKEPHAEIVFKAARLGDDVAQEIVDQTAEYLGIGLANLLHLLNPEVIALGGGVIQGGADLLLDPIRRAVARRCGSWVDLEGTRIVAALLGEDAGLLGAARLVWEAVRKICA
jgi:glucokinase